MDREGDEACLLDFLILGIWFILYPISFSCQIQGLVALQSARLRVSSRLLYRIEYWPNRYLSL